MTSDYPGRWRRMAPTGKGTVAMQGRPGQGLAYAGFRWLIGKGRGVPTVQARAAEWAVAVRRPAGRCANSQVFNGAATRRRYRAMRPGGWRLRVNRSATHGSSP